MIKRLSVVALSVCALAGLAAAPASAAPTAGGCISLHVNIGGTDLINQDVCTP